MEKLDYLEKQFKIDDWDGRLSFYEFDLNEDGEVISISLYNSEYEDLQTDGKNVLEVLSFYPKLENINIELHQLVLNDLSPIVNFPNLKNLYLHCTCNVEDIDCLAELRQLENIALYDTNIKNIDIFSALTNLKQISIDGGQIEDLTPLSGFKSLTGINFRNNLIKDISSLESNDNLQFLLLDSNRLTDVSVINNFKNLISLGLGGNEIKDVSSLENLNQLRYLNLLNNSIEVLNLNCEESLDCLYIQENNLKNLSFLEGYDKLKILNISQNPIDSYFPVTQLKGLEVLFSDGIRCEDVDKNQFLSQIKYLHLAGCGLTNLNFLRNQKEIIQINLNNNQISDVSVLCQFYNIRNILLKNNQLSEVFPLICFYEIDELDLRGNEFSGDYFIRYQGCSRIFHQEKIDDYKLIEDLRREIGVHYYSIGKYDHALANYFIDSTQYLSPIHFEIYLHKFLQIPSDNYFHLKFYFKKICHSLKRLKKENLKAIDDIEKQIFEKVNQIKNPEKTYFLEELNGEKNRFLLFKFHSEYLEAKNYLGKYEANFDPEIYLELAERGKVTRENLMRDLYYLKELKHLKSPFYYYLFNGIRKCLQMNFAYTQEERAEHDQFKEILFNLDKHDIPVPDSERHLTHPIQVRTKHDLPSSYNHEVIVQREIKDDNGFLKIRNFLLIFIIVLIILYLLTNRM